jgi:hypothetical protein
VFEMIAAYAVGTIVGVYLFREWTRERLVTTTLDVLIEQDYLRSYIDGDGVTQLYKWYELDDLVERIEDEDNDTP